MRPDRRHGIGGARLVAVALAAFGPLFHLDGVRAQEPEWRETTTSRFILLSTTENEVELAHVERAIEPLYRGLADAFGVELPGPVSVRLHPTVDSYLRANPLVVEMDGVLAGTRKRRRDVEVVVPVANRLGATGVDNALRRELARLMTGVRSDDALPEALVQGIARYLELPDEGLAGGVARLREASSRAALVGIEGLAKPGAVYEQPGATQAESRAFAQYVVDRYGFGGLISWLDASASAEGWREALENAFGLSPEAMQSGFEAWLPLYMDGAWREHALYSGDLARYEAMVAHGDLEAAAGHLRAVAALAEVDQPDLARQAADLLRRSDLRRTATEGLATSVTALAAGDYERAAATGRTARDALRDLGDAGSFETADEAVRRADLGREARRALTRASNLPAWRMVEARLLAGRAVSAFGDLGNQVERAAALKVVRARDRSLLLVAWMLVALGGVILARNALYRRHERREAAR